MHGFLDWTPTREASCSHHEKPGKICTDRDGPICCPVLTSGQIAAPFKRPRSLAQHIERNWPRWDCSASSPPQLMLCPGPAPLREKGALLTPTLSLRPPGHDGLLGDKLLSGSCATWVLLGTRTQCDFGKSHPLFGPLLNLICKMTGFTWDPTPSYASLEGAPGQDQGGHHKRPWWVMLTPCSTRLLKQLPVASQIERPQHKAEQDKLEKPKTLIVDMSYMVMNTMQRDSLQPRGWKPSRPEGPSGSRSWRGNEGKIGGWRGLSLRIPGPAFLPPPQETAEE